MANRKGFFCGITIGMITGFTAALLTTPKSGEELKKYLRGQDDAMRDAFASIKKEGITLTSQMKQLSKEGKVVLNDFKKDVGTSVKQWKNEVEPIQQKINEQLKAIETTMKEMESKASKR
jgi:gas vesicle protein